MKPNKIEWYLGLGSLAIMMDQDRKHWLLKADKTKSTQDPITGAMFHGQIMNVGSGIQLEVSKLPVDDAVVAEGTFSSENVSKILTLSKSVFPYVSKMNGLHFARLTSINLIGADESYHNFRLVLKNCTVKYIPMTPDKSADTIYSYKWYCTTTAPVLQMLDSDDHYTIEVPITFSAGVTNPVFYYPADEQLQPFSVTSNSNTRCETILITDPLSIGFPLFWFTCDESDMGPKILIGNNTTAATNPMSNMLEIGHVGATSSYSANIYPCTGDILYSAPTSDVTEWTIVCSSTTPFIGSSSDFDIPITTIEFKSMSQTNTFTFTQTGTNVITMSKDVGWTYDSVSGTYQVPLEAFAQNKYDAHGPMTPAFDIQLDESLPFEESTTDTGAASLFLSAERTAEQLPVYPDDINHLEGLPEWIRNPTSSSTAEHAVLYAAHNTPNYAPGNQYTRQIAGLIFDPGVERNYGQPSDGSDIGRVYVVSNDSIVYENNATAEHPKPARTIARICDIPTSIAQLSNIHGLAPTNVVDKKYIRSEASYTEADQDRIYNGLRNLWVRPTHLDEDGVPIYVEGSETQSNAFVFDSLENLQRVDLIDHNDFRTISNLNPSVDPMNVSVYAITNAGAGYQIGNIGIIIVGGFSFTYTVTAVDSIGGVLEVSLAPSDTGEINLANFDLYDSNNGLTKPYGSSPISDPSGTGLKVQFQIANFALLLPVKGNVVDNLYAFVRTVDGIWLYTYNTTSRRWVKTTQVVQSNESDTIAQNGSVSVRDSYIASILPSFHPVEVSTYWNSYAQQTLSAFSTATSINIVDQTKKPFQDYGTSPIQDKIDINKLYCHEYRTLTASSRSTQGVVEAVKEAGMDRYDSYLFWKWIDNNPQNLQFECGVIFRSLNNLMSTDAASLLPDNNLPSKKFVNTNCQTTIVWNIDHVGPLVWVFDPVYDQCERYTFDADAKQVIITKTPFDWKDSSNPGQGVPKTVDVCNHVGQQISLVVNNKLAYNIMTNNPYMIMRRRGSQWWPADNTTDIYQQPDYTMIMEKGEDYSRYQPIGGWRLIFPETHSFKFSGDVNDNSYVPVRMNIVRADDLSSVDTVYDSDGDVANYTSMLIDSSNGHPRLRIYDPNDTNPGWKEI